MNPVVFSRVAAQTTAQNSLIFNRSSMSSIAEGDMLVAFIVHGTGTTHVLNAPAGWSSGMPQVNVDGGTACDLAVFYRIVGPIGSEPSQYLFTATGGTSSEALAGVIVAVQRGTYDAGAPFDEVGFNTTTASTVLAAPAIDTTVDRCTYLRAAAYADPSATVATIVPASTTDPISPTAQQNATNRAGVALFAGLKLVAGNVASENYTYSGSNKNSLVTVTMAIRPNPVVAFPVLKRRSVVKTGTTTSGITFDRTADGSEGADMGVETGDLLVAVINAVDTNIPTITPPSGWTLLASPNIDQGVAVRHAVYYRFVTDVGTEPTTYAFTATPASASNAMHGLLLRVKHADPANISQVNSTNFSAVSQDNWPTVTAVVGNSLIIATRGHGDAAVATWNAAGTGYNGFWTELAEGTSDPTNAGSIYAGIGAFNLPGDSYVLGARQISVVGTTVDNTAGVLMVIGPSITDEQGELTISDPSTLSIEGNAPHLAIEGDAQLAITGHPGAGADNIHLIGVSTVVMEGQQVGGFTTVLDSGRTTIAFEGFATLEVGSDEEVVGAPPEEGEVIPPDPEVWIQRMIRAAPSVTPYLDANGRPDADAWTAAFPEPNYNRWGRLRVNVGGKWVSNYRGIPAQVASWTKAEPFGDETAVIRFPQITPFEALPSWLNDESNVSIYQALPNGTTQVIFEGLVASIEDDGEGVLVQCMGALYQLDYYVNRAHLTEHGPMDIGHLIAREVTPNARDRRAFRCISINKANTGIELLPRGGWEPLLTGYVADLLSQCFQDDGDQWTVKKEPGRKPKMTLKDRTTQHYSVHVGEPGVEVNLRLDSTLGTTTIFGEGIYESCHWYNAKYPNIRYGDLPVFSGTLIHPDDIHPDFGLFSQELYNRGWTGFDAGGLHYGLHEEVWVREFQAQSGVQVDGIVGPQTWAAAFGVGADASELEGAFIHSIASRSYTEAYFRDASGSQTTKNPAFDSKRLRIERYVNYGSQISKEEAIRSAWGEINRDSVDALFGTIILRTDPPEISRLEIEAGKNIRLRNYRGTSPLLHISHVSVDWVQGVTTLQVDQKARDNLTLAQMLTRDRETTNPSRRREVTRRNRSRSIRDEKPVWDCESGAGIVPAHAIYAGLWNVIRIPTGKNGTIVRSYFQVENPTQLAVGIFDRPMTAAQMLKGSGETQGNPLEYLEFWDQFGDELLVAWGGRENPAGWSPYDSADDAEDQGVLNPTGILDDRGTWYYETVHAPWLWVALWVEPRSNLENNIAFIQGRLHASNEPT